MYVDDVDDLEELEYLLDEARQRLDANPGSQQAAWNIEDIQERIEEVKNGRSIQITNG